MGTIEDILDLLLPCKTHSGHWWCFHIIRFPVQMMSLERGRKCRGRVISRFRFMDEKTEETGLAEGQVTSGIPLQSIGVQASRATGHLSILSFVLDDHLSLLIPLKTRSSGFPFNFRDSVVVTTCHWNHFTEMTIYSSFWTNAGVACLHLL